MRTVGIKLADGSFYPIMEEGTAQKKTLELTTAHNNQTCVMVDLYRSKTCSMEDAEYIDTLKIENLKDEYDLKVSKAIELIQKEFDPSEISYNDFISTLNNSNNIFYNNVEVALDIIELSSNPSVKIKNELDNKINTLNEIIDKLEDFIDELIIHIAEGSEKEVKNLTKELDDLIDSVKDY